MVDVVSKAKRSQMMSGIRGKNTKPERQIGRMLHARGFRYRLHHAGLPGKPDFVFPRYRAVILVNGCFWHGHGCHLFKWPKSRPDFWKEKIGRNIERDQQNLAKYTELNWRVAIVWECALKGRLRIPGDEIAIQLADWLRGDLKLIEVKGQSSNKHKVSTITDHDATV